MNAVTRHSGTDPETTRETPADGQQSPTISFDARARLRGAFDDVTVQQAVLGATADDNTPADTVERRSAATY
ncbi:hypothetical protein EGH24_00280 [Halonotius terrestris]|uniref:Uncharacterized protein n=1 Tax=Halonotius terrestris TaxID=2487750 RepID=A0A8J8TDG4_9EURY|nr:hypothetical protein [Halonotius terrestris]TQQ83277.1 hypothetical protein EGH24_00280 [Halonotius terrestris]